jgi:DNA-binding Xre family transcriptional regulator
MSTKVSEPKGAKENVKEPKKAKAIVSDGKKKSKKAKKVKAVKKVKVSKVKEDKPEKVKESNTKNYPKFRYWLMDNDITQKDLAKRTHLSVNTVYRLNTFGKGSKSIIKLVAMELNLTEEALTEMLKP